VGEGKFEATKNEADKYFFKTPSLRNIEKTYPYFHDGSIEKLEDAINIMAKTQLNKELTTKETSDMVAFLKTLTGEVPQHLKQ
jgi:cytochrome c peroxidase